MNRGRSKISGLAIAKLPRTGLFWHAFLIPLINTYLRLFSEYEQQTLYKRTSVQSPFCRTFIARRDGAVGGGRSVCISPRAISFLAMLCNETTTLL